MGLRAVIYIVDGAHTARWERACVDWCEAKRYEVVAVVVDDEATAARWSDIARMLAAGQADVCVTPRLADLPAHRIPRVEPILLTERPDQQLTATDPGS